jgi:replicative DNA helicase
VHLGKEALLRGLKVLHITHELSLEDTEMRYDKALGGLTSSEEIETTVFEDIDEEGNVINTESIDVTSVFNLKEVQEVRKRVAKFGGELIIRKYPMGLCTMNEIRRYLDYLETYENFIPDVVINDYIEKMKLSSGDGRRDAINEAYMESKGIADERKLLMITVSQVTREALRKRKLDQKDFAEDIRKLGNVDLVLAFSQTDAQAQENRMIAWVMANRSGLMDFGCIFSQNLDIGQFCITDWPLKVERARDEKETEV